WHGCGMQTHGETQFHTVATLPGPTENKVATRVRESGYRTSIHLYVAAPRPVRNTQLQIDIDGFGRRNKQSRSLLLGESSLLRYANAFFWPADFGRDVQIDEHGVVIVKVDGVRQLGELLGPCAAAAPERIERLGVDFGVAVSQWQIIDGCARLRVNGPHAVIEQHTLVVVHELRPRRPT